MTIPMKEKQFLAAIARDLIKRLQFCEDEEFVDYVITCVLTKDASALNPENLR